MKLKTKNYLTGAELSRTELSELLIFADKLRDDRAKDVLRDDLRGRTVALLFDKPSLRTRVSFAVAVEELGGKSVILETSGRKKEDPEDTVRVLSGFCHGLMVRTHAQSILDAMAKKSTVPIINGLSDSHHPCQALADILTLKQRFNDLKGLRLTYLGDGNNVLHSLLLLAPQMGIDVHYACPAGYEPSSLVVKQAKRLAKDGGGQVVGHLDPVEAVKGTDAIYTDVWTSMGFEQEEADRDMAFKNFQVNEELYSFAKPHAVIMHCMPMVREKEITSAMVEHENSVLFRQAENRLHVQKALLIGLLGRNN